jgi:precorrin-2/cobalt-factor-2 C20-methyltransferase
MIYLVGMGPGDPGYITEKAREIIEQADRVYAFPRHLEQMGIPENKGEPIQCNLTDLPKKLGAMNPSLSLAVLVSGDPLVFSLSRRFTRALDPSRWTIIPGLGSAQVLGARLGLQSPLPAQLSLHGRSIDNLLPALYRQEPVILYTDGENSPTAIARYLKDHYFPHWRMVIGRNLSREDEEIIETTPRELLGQPERDDWGINLVFLAPLEEAVKKKGFLYGIGIGPGDPELIPLKAMRILRQSDVILTPCSSWKKASVARAILEQAAGKDLPFREMVYPMSEDKGVLSTHWQQAAQECASLLKEGKQVSFITLGDPSLYSTFSYLCHALEEIMPDAQWEIIPGISSIQLAAARLKIPLALGKDKCVILPTPDDMEELRPYLENHESVVLMKVGKRLGDLKQFLADEGLNDQAAFINRAGFAEEYKAYSFNDLDDSREGYLSIVMIRTGIGRDR